LISSTLESSRVLCATAIKTTSPAAPTRFSPSRSDDRMTLRSQITNGGLREMFRFPLIERTSTRAGWHKRRTLMTSAERWMECGNGGRECGPPSHTRQHRVVGCNSCPASSRSCGATNPSAEESAQHDRSPGAKMRQSARGDPRFVTGDPSGGGCLSRSARVGCMGLRSCGTAVPEMVIRSDSRVRRIRTSGQQERTEALPPLCVGERGETPFCNGREPAPILDRGSHASRGAAADACSEQWHGGSDLINDQDRLCGRKTRERTA